MTSGDLAIRNIGVLATLAGPAPRLGAALRDARIVQDAAVLVTNGRIAFAGPERDLPAGLPEPPQVIDAQGAAVIPGFVDGHTHLAFAGDRDDEVRERLAGVSYAEIAARGGGILKTVEATRRASSADLTTLVAARLDALLLGGTTTAEVKSGYGLDTAAEVRSLEAIRDAAASHPVDVSVTFLGAHEVPPEHCGARTRYVDVVVDEMIPEVARRGLAESCDVFCEAGVFDVGESRRILEAAAAAGLERRVHADELSWTGGAELAARVGARSADHLLHVSPAGIAALAASGCIATLCPTAAFYLRLGRQAPARALIDAGVAVALATDVNPGGGLSASMPFAMTMACFGLGLSVEEALAAATLNGACSLGRQREVGSLETGKRADLVVLRSPRLVDLLRVGAPAVAHVVKDGVPVVRDGRRV